MSEIDSMIVSKTNGDVILERFIDDYFAFLMSQQITAEKLLTLANGLNDAIAFTLDKPNNNELPFLDTLVSFNTDTKTFNTKLYIKPVHSRCITPWESHGSVAFKKAILVGEVNRAIARSTDQNTQMESLEKITQVFIDNGYPRKLIKATVRRLVHKKSEEKQQQKDDKKYIYLKLPFISEEIKRRALQVVRRSGIDNVRVHFINGRPSSRVFGPPRERIQCSETCVTCKSALQPNRCQQKNVVYCITCINCQNLYIGETGRTIGSRIKEHLSMKKQTVYRHIKSHGDVLCDHTAISWKILHNNIQNANERKCIEAIEIQQCSSIIMNGCIGRTMTI